MPDQSTPWEEVYRDLSQQCGVVALTDWSQIDITGSDRATFLHNMCTNEIRKLSAGQCCEAFCTDVKGKIQAQVFVFIEQDRISLLTVPGQAERIIAQLGRYVIREDVELADSTAKYAWWIVVGPQAHATLKQNTENENDIPTQNYNHATCTLAGQQGLVARLPILWPGALLVRTAATDSPLNGLDVPTIDTDSPVWSSLRVESQLPLFGIDFDDSNLPQEVNRDAQSISFTKGCYLGQETVARIDALGHVNKKVVLVSIQGTSVPKVGAKLLSGDSEVGTITTPCWSPQASRPAALAMVKRGANEIGSEMESPAGSAVIVESLQNQ
ncbi:CAF17-like 4Fe-4S cluster assembly/insertion protein YgfZ [Bythopirellula goksoeyrii]|uniref:tRNA-modifying protein YgfZ n=1 Tax=Bythopirellula goksoeyrii TaxID=1400387 RepID=A0A5B9Q521_9BACT|nr:glycine cleavage T C-terminal barrel domain-containing protein [Bythopirellula goksoeyrii]QEG34077.1 tRNA-modifying protein YgfZ [Bythopirellula goksoeyrii]